MSIKNFLFKFPDIFKKKSLDALTNTTTEFPQLDLEQLCIEWRLAEIGEDDGKKISHLLQLIATVLKSNKLL